MTARELLSAMAFALATGETPRSADWYPDPRSFEAAVEAFRAEVLNEAADLIDNDDECDCGGCDTCQPRKLAALLRQHAAPQPDTTGDVMANPAVRVGQVWADNDPRAYSRKLRVVELTDTHAIVELASSRGVGNDRAKPGRRTRIRLDRFKPTSTGYRLVEDTKEQS